jgi:hypothetical protein
MKTLSIFDHLYENKTSRIKKLKNLSDDEKEELIDFFQKHPNLENKIDWNNPDLTYNDFTEIIADTFVSKSNVKKQVKEGDLGAIWERHPTAKIIYQTDNIIMVVPTTLNDCKFMNSPSSYNTNAKWCIGDNYNYFEQHIKNETFIFIYAKHSTSNPDGIKLMLSYSKEKTCDGYEPGYSVWKANDKYTIISEPDINIIVDYINKNLVSSFVNENEPIMTEEKLLELFEQAKKIISKRVITHLKGTIDIDFMLFFGTEDRWESDYYEIMTEEEQQLFNFNVILNSIYDWIYEYVYNILTNDKSIIYDVHNIIINKGVVSGSGFIDVEKLRSIIKNNNFDINYNHHEKNIVITNIEPDYLYNEEAFTVFIKPRLYLKRNTRLDVIYNKLIQENTKFSGSHLYENKTSRIKKLNNLSDSEKEELIDFFEIHPNLENKIDWNNPDLTFDDFTEIIADTAISKNNVNKQLKEGDLGAIWERHPTAEILYQTDNIIFVAPTTWEDYKFINSLSCYGIGAKWCLGSSKHNMHWKKYTEQGDILVFVYSPKGGWIINGKMYHGIKVMLSLSQNPTVIEHYSYPPGFSWWDSDNDLRYDHEKTVKNIFEDLRYYEPALTQRILLNCFKKAKELCNNEELNI